MISQENEKQTLSIILPIFEEAEHINHSVDVIRETLNKIDISIEFILVDDGSSDNTWHEIKRLADDNKDIRSLSFSRNFGKECAIAAGLEHAKGDVAIILDADLQHPPNIIPEMIALWRNDEVKIVNAVKSYRGRESIIQKTTTKAFYKVYKTLSGVDLRGASDFKLLDRDVIDSYNGFNENGLFFRGLVPWLGFKTDTITFDVQDRVAGSSKWTGLTRLILAVNSITSFSDIPLQIVTFIGVIFCAFSVLFGGQTIVMWLSGHAIEGFTTIILLLLIIGSVLMLSLGIIGQYISKIYREIKLRPLYVLKSKAGFDNENNNT
ncbi:MAG: glycosyltransferase [Zetaproteobacteria bacterium]|nr:MAG: glycosyltransferase [Zetaproteobacteria bacterium]